MKEILVRQFWAGFCDGQIDVREVDTGWGGFGKGGKRLMAAIFPSRALAKEQYEDVRRVNVKLPIRRPTTIKAR
jgi:hypothetical protein